MPIGWADEVAWPDLRRLQHSIVREMRSTARTLKTRFGRLDTRNEPQAARSKQETKRQQP